MKLNDYTGCRIRNPDIREVKSHVKFKAQAKFENGDPFGNHQFVTTVVTIWAIAGLAQLLPSKSARPGP